MSDGEVNGLLIDRLGNDLARLQHEITLHVAERNRLQATADRRGELLRECGDWLEIGTGRPLTAKEERLVSAINAELAEAPRRELAP